ncbi:uncharacterized protein [Aristolochia californica]|uniref:uncharacterized protein n=1 Tax=Aristolochia californica TaxID=171875 RepID=UPI0035DA7B0E
MANLKPLLMKRRTWACLFVLVYGLLLSSSWNLIRSIVYWYNTTTTDVVVRWPALYASVLFGAVFGLLAMVSALTVAIPATVVTWITALVLLAFAGQPRRSLVLEGRKITADIAALAIKILLKEGNLVAAVCAFLSFVALFRNHGGED